MKKAYRLQLLVVQIDLKHDSGLARDSALTCTCLYGKQRFSTASVKLKPDSIAWNEAFETIYWEKTPLAFVVRLQTLDSAAAKDLFRGEVDLQKKIGSSGLQKVALKGEGKATADLTIDLQWREELVVTPFKLEVVIHTVDLSPTANLEKASQARAKVLESHAAALQRRHGVRDERSSSQSQQALRLQRILQARHLRAAVFPRAGPDRPLGRVSRRSAIDDHLARLGEEHEARPAQEVRPAATRAAARHGKSWRDE